MAVKHKKIPEDTTVTLNPGEFVSWAGHLLQVTLMLITPEQAAEWFNNTQRLVNKGLIPQRKVSQRIAEYLTSVMNENDFMTTHQGICLFTVDKTTGAIDGQHRLLAIMNSGKPQLMLVFRGFPTDIFKGIDNNVVPRKPADIFMNHPGRQQISKPAATRITSIAKIVMAKNGTDIRNPVNIADFADVHRNFMAITTIDQMLKMGNRRLKTNAVAAFVKAALWSEDKGRDVDVMIMIERFSKQKWNSEDDVMLSLREEMVRLMQMKMSSNQKSPKSNDYYLATIEAINAGLHNEKIKNNKFTYKVEVLK